MQRRYPHFPYLGAIFIITGIFCVVIIVCELTLRSLFHLYYVWPPRMHITFTPIERIHPGILGKSDFIINSFGIRGDEFSQNQDYRILAIGGSTTISEYLDQKETWAYLLQQELSEGSKNVWVGNVGKSGFTSRSHIVQIKYLIPQYPKIDAVICLIGVNDLQKRLAKDNFEPVVLKDDRDPIDLSNVFVEYPVWKIEDKDTPFHQKTFLWHLLKKLHKAIFIKYHKVEIFDEAGNKHEKYRNYRKYTKEMRSELPDMNSLFVEYRQNLNAMIDLAQKYHVRIIFATQPVLWKEGLSDELNNLLWFGWVGNVVTGEPKAYYSVEALKKGMDSMNEILRDVCRKRSVECIDLVPKLPQDTSVFYDDCHLNENGSRQIAKRIAAYFKEKEISK